MRARLLLSALLAAAAMPSLAADPRGRAEPEPGLCKERAELNPDIFGFSSGSDVATVGSVGLGFEIAPAFETRSGKFASHEGKAQIGIGLLPCVEIGPSIIGNREVTKAFQAIDEETSSFFGAGLEMKLKLLGRAQHGFGLTLVAEPTFGRVRERTRGEADDGTGTLVPFRRSRHFDEWGLASKVLVDTVLVPDRVFLAFNLAHEASWPDVTPNDDSSTLIASAAVSLRVTDSFYGGIEARYLKAYKSAWFDRPQGDAWFLGPTFLWAIGDNITLSGTWSTQISGKASPNPMETGQYASGRLNLIDFNHHEAKAKLGIAF